MNAPLRRRPEVAPIRAVPSSPAVAAFGLPALESRLREDLERLCLPADDWLARSADDPVLDVAIVGGGMAGLAAAVALWQLGIRRVRVFDRQAPGAAGPWLTHARMETLRSPKHLVGPAPGLPSATFRAWYEARSGKAGWAALDRIPRQQWQAYLNWFGQVFGVDIESRTQVDAIDGEMLPEGRLGVGFDMVRDGRRSHAQARHLVLASGMDGLGGPAIPALVGQLPRACWQHSSETIDFARWRGRRIGIIGGGDSALDAAATALEAGVAHVDVFIRAGDFARINYWKAFAHVGHYHGFPTLTPAERQPLLDFLKRQKVPPARGTVQRLARHDNVSLRFASPVEALTVGDGETIEVATAHGRFAVDHLILATGYRTDFTLRPELRTLAPHIRRWSDRVPGHAAGFPLDGFPETAADFSLREREPGRCPVLAQVHLLTGAALLSQGKLTGDIPGIGLGAERLARGIAARLYRADFDAQQAAVEAYDEREVTGAEWQSLRVDPVPPGRSAAPVDLAASPGDFR